MASRYHDAVEHQLRHHPERSYRDIAHRVGCSIPVVSRIAGAVGLRRYGTRQSTKMDLPQDRGEPVCHCGQPLSFDSDLLTGRSIQICPTHGRRWLVA